MEITPLEKAIFRTLAYFAYAQLPLTEREVYLWLLSPEGASTPQEVKNCLATSSWLKKNSDRSGIYISLRDTAQWVKEREKKYRDAERKHARARVAARYIMRLPGVKGVAICNSLAWHATHEQGDIDLFIATEKGMVWGTRLLIAGSLRLLGARPGEARRDPLCVSFFVDEEAFALEALRENDEDWYLAYWIASLAWIGGKKELSEHVFLKNSWIKSVLPHARLARCIPVKTSDPAFRLPLRIPESCAKKVQEHFFSEQIREKQNTSSHVIVNDHMLKFHDNDRRAAISAFVRLHMQQAGL